LIVGLIGVYGWRGKNARGEVGPIPDLDLINFHDRIITIVFDSDVATNEKVKEARAALARELYRRGARIVYKIDLPTLDGEKVGIDDFLKDQGIEAFADLDIEEIASPYPRVKLWSGIELRETPMERPPAIVKGWGIRRAGKGLICGQGGRGKTTLVSQVACHLGAGTPPFGYAGLEVSGPQRVAVFMAEDPLSEVRFRWVKQMEVLGYGNEVAERIAFLDPQGSRLSLTDEHARTALFDALRRHRADICILDPLVAVHDADENSNSAMRSVLDLLAPYQEETGCTFVVVHHEPKVAENNGAAARGASAIRDWCRTMLRLAPQKAGSDGSQRFQLDLDKANYGGTVWALTLERKQDSYIFTPVDLEAAVTPRDVWEMIGVDGNWLDEVQNLIVERFNVSKATAYRAIKKAEEKKLAVIGERVNLETNRRKSYLARGTGSWGEE
jgi:RecA-family ATPase